MNRCSCRFACLWLMVFLVACEDGAKQNTERNTSEPQLTSISHKNAIAIYSALSPVRQDIGAVLKQITADHIDRTCVPTPFNIDLTATESSAEFTLQDCPWQSGKLISGNLKLTIRNDESTGRRYSLAADLLTVVTSSDKTFLYRLTAFTLDYSPIDANSAKLTLSARLDHSNGNIGLLDMQTSPDGIVLNTGANTNSDHFEGMLIIFGKPPSKIEMSKMSGTIRFTIYDESGHPQDFFNGLPGA